ncbi:hypothetical protein BASA81_008461 [Batrachochytrium salamandrivorans]|nr:hypothetical protein BASA81_008461 [Batrachochytrium salamandrivorans]
MELPRALRELQEARDASWSLQCFGQIVSIARDLPSSQDLFPLSVKFEIDPNLGVKLLGEMKRALGKSANNKHQLWKVFGQLLFWGFELHRLGQGRANDVQFETQLNLVLEFAWGESELLPHHLDTFFAKAIAQSRSGARLGEAVDNCLERFLSKSTSNLELQFDPFCRSVVLRAPRTSLLPVLRCVAGKVYTQSLDPVLVRLMSFLLGTLDFTADGGGRGEVEHQAAMECIRGDFNLVRVASEALLQSRGTMALEEETGLVQLVSKLYVCVASKWQLLLERTSNAVTIQFASCMELVLTKLCKAKRQAESALVNSLTRAIAVILATASPLKPSASNTSTTIQTFKQQADEENQLFLSALRVNFALCFHTDSPQSELFGLPLHNNKLGCSSALIYLLLLALGFESNASVAGGEVHFEQLLFQRLKRVLGENETLVLWSAGEFALQMHSGAFPVAECWHFSFTLAARRIRDLQRPKTAAQDKLELLFHAFHGLQEVRSSIRHLQDLAWFYIAFGKRQGFSIAGERFLGDVAKTLFDLKRYWECGNVYVMLGTCDLACKRYTGSSHHFSLASEAFDKLGLHRESHKVRLASRVFAKQSLFPREWDWCLMNGNGDGGGGSFAHYFLVGAVGLGDADLTVVRIVLSSWQLYELAFDEAVRYLESGSYRRCIAGQLRWDIATGVAKFFPSEVVGQDEFGFWIQRVWPVSGEEDVVEHCSSKWGVVGESTLVIEVKDQRRGLNALISACSVLVDVVPLPGLELDVPVDWDTGEIPLPLHPPPASANHSYFPTNESVSFHDSAVAGKVSFLPDDSFGEEEEIRPPSSPPPSELDIAPPSSPPPSQSSSLLSAITPPDVISDAEQRKREFKRRREQGNLLLQQQQEEAARMQKLREEALKQERKEEKRLRKEQEAAQQQQQEEEAAKRARSEVKRKQLVEQAAAAEALQRQQDEILRQQEEAERLRAEHRLQQQQQREAEEQLALKQQLEAQYYAEQQNKLLQEQQSRLFQEQQSRLFQEQQSQEQIQLEVEQEHQRLQEQKRMLKQRQQQQQSINTTFEALPSAGTAAGTTNPMLILKRKQQPQPPPPSPPQQYFEQQSTTPPKNSGSFSRRVVLLPTNNSTSMEDVLQRSSPPKNLFNVNGAKISLEEWEQLERFKAKGEGWLGATVLSQGQVSLRFTKGPTVEVYLEPKFELLCTLVQVRQVMKKEGSNMLEMRGNGGDSLLLVCAQEEMLRALISTFN